MGPEGEGGPNKPDSEGTLTLPWLSNSLARLEFWIREGEIRHCTPGNQAGQHLGGQASKKRGMVLVRCGVPQ